MFYEATYSGVTWFQLFGGWILFFGWMIIKFLLWALVEANKVPDYLWGERFELIATIESLRLQAENPLSGRETAELIRPWSDACLKWEERFRAKEKLHNQDLQELSRTIDKLRSLEAELAKFKDRTRGPDGKFRKSDG